MVNSRSLFLFPSLLPWIHRFYNIFDNLPPNISIDPFASQYKLSLLSKLGLSNTEEPILPSEFNERSHCELEEAARYRDELKEIAPHFLLKCSSDSTTLVDSCRVLFTMDVQYTSSVERAHASPASSTEQASCPVCLEIPANYSSFVDKVDGYSYIYPSDWRVTDYRGHDSAFKDRYLQLQNVRLSFIPTEKSDICEMGSLQEYIPGLLKRAYAAPNQRVTILDMLEVARNLGKTLRAFQPTIRELQDVSREFKSTLEKEIGLDEIRNPMQSNYSCSTTTPISRPPPVTTPEDSQATVDPNGTSSLNKAYSSEDYLKITEEQLKAAASVQQKEQTPSLVAGTELEPLPQAQETIQGRATTTPQLQKPKDES